MTDKQKKFIDISEDEILSWGHGILQTLLLDRTTGRNIYWATDDYANKGDGYSFFDEITIEKITAKNANVIQPRIMKSLQNQRNRSRKMAEVFTPSWICNAQNNLIDEAWWGDRNIFNHTTGGSEVLWEYNSTKPFPKGKTWKDYVVANRMEMACGEAPYLCSRFDAASGEPFHDVNARIGILDRKLRVVSENAREESIGDRTAAWRRWALKAYQSTYGFEWQGDSLLIARESLLWTYREHFKARWGQYPMVSALKKIAEIISWNIWQMDGLTCGLPGRVPNEKGENLCLVMEWSSNRTPSGTPIKFKDLTQL